PRRGRAERPDVRPPRSQTGCPGERPRAVRSDVRLQLPPEAVEAGDTADLPVPAAVGNRHRSGAGGFACGFALEVSAVVINQAEPMAGSERTEFRMALGALITAALALVLEVALPSLRAAGLAIVVWSVLLVACVVYRVRRWLLRGRLQPIRPLGSEVSASPTA